jgi:hypothetical protein
MQLNLESYLELKAQQLQYFFLTLPCWNCVFKTKKQESRSQLRRKHVEAGAELSWGVWPSIYSLVTESNTGEAFEGNYAITLGSGVGTHAGGICINRKDVNHVKLG